MIAQVIVKNDPGKGIVQDKVTKDISINVQIKPFFAAKNFYIKLSGHDGKDGREWDQEVE